MQTCLCIPAATTVYIPMLQPMSKEKGQGQVRKEKGSKNSPRSTASGYLLSTRTTFLTMFISHPPWLWQGTFIKNGYIGICHMYLLLNQPRHVDVCVDWFDAHLVGWEGKQRNTFFQKSKVRIYLSGLTNYCLRISISLWTWLRNWYKVFFEPQLS